MRNTDFEESINKRGNYANEDKKVFTNHIYGRLFDNFVWVHAVFERFLSIWEWISHVDGYV